MRVYGGYTVNMMFCLTRRQWVLSGVLCLLVLCVLFVPQFVFADLVGGIASVLAAVLGGLLKGLTLILGLFQLLFLQVVEFTILNFAANWQEGGYLSDFRVVWQVLRDFVNLVIVVLFVLTAMMTAFGNGLFGFRHKSLVYLIGAAIFVNFSAFFTLFILDISHILFMLFFNALDATSWGSLSPFSGYTEILGDVGTGVFNLVLFIIAIVVTWFIILGILYFCIILIERYVIAMFLVLLSPIAALGFFTSLSGGNPLASKFSGFYGQWKDKLGYVFSMPVVLILGFTLLLVLFRGALGQATDPSNFVTLLGLSNPQGRALLIQIAMASIVLILGIFKVGEAAKKANIHSAIAGKFKFGEMATGVADKMAKLSGPKAAFGYLRSIRNPAGRGVGNWKQKLYNKRDQWKREGSRLANIPGVGKSLDLGRKVRRASRAAQTIAKGVDTVADGKSGRNIAWKNAEVREDKRISDIIHNGTFKQKRELLKQALDGKSNVTLTERQTDKLVQNPKLHPWLSQLNKGVSQSAYRRMYTDAQKDAQAVVSEQGRIDAQANSFSDEYKAKRQELQSAEVDFKEAEMVYADVGKQKDLAQEQYDSLAATAKDSERQAQQDHDTAVSQLQEREAEAQEEYDAARTVWQQTGAGVIERDIERQQKFVDDHLQRGTDPSQARDHLRTLKEALTKHQTDYAAEYAVFSDAESNLQAHKDTMRDELPKLSTDLQNGKAAVQDELSKSSEAAVLKEMNDVLQEAGDRKKEADIKKKVAEEAFEKEQEQHAVPLEKDQSENNEDKRKVAQLFSNLAANASANVAVSRDAVAVFDSDKMTDAQEKRESVAAPVQEDFAAMNNSYVVVSGTVEEALKEEEKSIDAQNERDTAALIEKKEAYEEEREKNPNPDVLTDPMKQLQGEIDVLEQAFADRRSRSLEIDKKKEQIKSIKDDLNKTDASDARKLEILGESVSSANSFMQEGTQYLQDNLKVVTEKIESFETSARVSGIDLNTNDEYKGLQNEQNKFQERLQQISDVGKNVTAVEDVLDAHQEILEGEEYKNALAQEQYLTMFNVKTLLGDAKEALRERRKKFRQEYAEKEQKRREKDGEPTTGKIKVPQNAHKEDPAWKALDQWRKNLERIQKEGGASSEQSKKAAEASEKAAKQKKSQRKR